MGILIQEKYRGRQRIYSVPALFILERVTFEKRHLRIIQFYPPRQAQSSTCVQKTGFVHTDKTRRELAFGEARTAMHLLITTEMCAVYKETAFPCGRA